jgi:glycosyltransferase involved in cell wall biosynthesis
MRILLVSDAWAPQINGVVNTLGETVRRLRQMGHAVLVASPDRFRTVRMPTEPDIRLALGAGPRLRALVEPFAPDIVHIATEGPLGWSARRLARARGIPITTAYHTRFPEYLRARLGVPSALTYNVVRRFHAPSRRVLVATESLARELRQHGFTNLARWPRGVDTELFRPGPRDAFDAPMLTGRPEPLPRPYWLSIGRLAAEKNLDAFLSLPLPGTKIVVGDGPERAKLEARFPEAVFLGARAHDALAPLYAAADVFVFPSRTDTFGLVLLEAMACGTPVAAYPVCGPLDVVGTSGAGVIDTDLRRACHRALRIKRDRPRAHAMSFSWDECTRLFASHLQACLEPASPAG